jgi:pimeloyl-ACP methyl ester carboxylesterase
MTTVLLHPVGLDADSWQFVTLPEAARHEYPGHGRRPLDPPDFSLEFLADEVAETYSEPLDLVGISLGGIVAQHVALRHPNRVRSLFLACTTGATEPEILLARAEAVTSQPLEKFVDVTLRRWFGEDPVSDSSNLAVAYARRRLLTDDPRAIAACWRAMTKHHTLENLRQVTVPVTCLAGRNDAAASGPVVETLYKALPNARFEMVDGPHMLQLQCPGLFTAAVKRHFEWVAGSEN